MTQIRIELGHTIEEIELLQAKNSDCWSFTIEDFFGGAIEPNEDMVYWLVNGRIYETPYN